MPNHVESDLYVTPLNKEGRKQLAAFKKHAQSENEDLCHNNFIPYPEHFAEADRAAEAERQKFYNKEIPAYPSVQDGYNSGGYQWCLANWGTKWGIYRSKLKRDSQKGLTYSFETAWSAPHPIIKKMSELYPDLRFTMKSYERGMGFKLHVVWENGKMVKNVEGRYNGNRGG